MRAGEYWSNVQYMSTPLSITRQLLELFQGPLRDVRFPDADGERLGAAVNAASAAAEAVAAAEAALETARASAVEKERVVAHETDRALAYARVYAADRPDLREVIAAVTSRPLAEKRGRGRPRKVVPPSAVEGEAAAAE